jgi:hypothetical protein
MKQICRWFALCENVAWSEMWHDKLGYVPICAKCAAWVNQQEKMKQLKQTEDLK